MEKRKHARVATYKTATIFFGRNIRGISCFLMDISEGGAGLHVANVAGIPDTFELLIHGETDKRPCKVAWKMGKRVGVSFLTDNHSAEAKAKFTTDEGKKFIDLNAVYPVIELCFNGTDVARSGDKLMEALRQQRATSPWLPLLESCLHYARGEFDRAYARVLEETGGEAAAGSR